MASALETDPGELDQCSLAAYADEQVTEAHDGLPVYSRAMHPGIPEVGELTQGLVERVHEPVTVLELLPELSVQRGFVSKEAG